MTELDFPDATHEDLRGAAMHLEEQSGQGRGHGVLHGRGVDDRGRGAFA